MGLSPEAANISQALRKHVKACLALGYGGSNQAIEAGVMRCVRSLRILLTPADIAALELGGIPEWITTAAVNEHFCAPRIRQLRGVPDRHVRDRACEMFVSDVKASIAAVWVDKFQREREEDVKKLFFPLVAEQAAARGLQRRLGQAPAQLHVLLLRLPGSGVKTFFHFARNLCVNHFPLFSHKNVC